MVAGGTVGEFDVLIQELSSWAMEGVFAEMSKSLITASLTSPEAKRGQEMSGIGVEQGTSHLPIAFRVSLQSAIAQVKAIARVSDQVRRAAFAFRCMCV